MYVTRTASTGPGTAMEVTNTRGTAPTRPELQRVRRMAA